MIYRRICLLEQYLVGVIVLCSVCLLTQGAVKQLMKAAVLRSFDQPNSIEITEVETPSITNTQILVQSKASGINIVDAYMKAGTYPTQPALPTILGKEVAGLIEKVGLYVTKFKVGDRVFCEVPSGAFAEFVVANQSNCFIIPDVLTFKEGAAIYIDYFTAYRALVIKGNIKKEHTVLIHGAAEGIGPAAVQIARMVGSKVIATVKSRISEDLINKSGADYINFQNNPMHLSVMVEKLNISGFDIILENLDDNYDLEWDKHHLSPNGRIIVVGNRGYVTVDVTRMAATEASLYGVTLYKYTEEEKRKAAEFVQGGFHTGILQPIIGGEYPLEEATRALRDVTFSNAAARGKLIFIFQNTSCTE